MTDYDALLAQLEEIKDVLKDLLENADLTKSQRKKIGDLLNCETASSFRYYATKYSIGISYDEDYVYITFFGKNEEFEKPKALIGKKAPWKRFFQQLSQEKESTPSESLSKSRSNYDALLAQLEALDPSTIEVDADAANVDPEETFDYLVKQLRKQGVKFTKPLANAIKKTGHHREIIRSETWLQDLIKFLHANRDFLEKVYSSGRFLPPFSISFEDVSAKLQTVFINLAKSVGIKNPGNLIAISEGRTDVIVLLLPITKNEFHLIAATVRRRRWYIPPSKADENLREFRRNVDRTLKGISRAARNRIRNETYILIGRYTTGVRGFFRRKGLSKSKQAITVFDDRNRNWFVLILKFLKNLFYKRVDGQLRSGAIYGEAAERLKNLQTYAQLIAVYLLKE